MARAIVECRGSQTAGANERDCIEAPGTGRTAEGAIHMRILLIAHGFNGLTQRLHAELRADGHEVSFEYDIADSVTEEAVALWRPEVLIAPFMKRRIPESVWSRVPCLVVHPGPPGDRGPAALDWAVLDGAREWGVTVLQANVDAAREALAAAGRGAIEVNAPGTNSSIVLPALAEAGATQCEPGNALHGTTPLHAVEDLPEDPAVLYLTEVSHHHGGSAFCFGGGLYIDPVFPKYDVRALVSSQPTTAPNALASVEIPDYSAIDYYGMIDATGPNRPKTGDTVIFGFRGQAFVTRANIVGISGVATGTPAVTTIENIFGEVTGWPRKGLS